VDAVFENVYDVLKFLVHHFPVGFQSVEEREAAKKVIDDQNPLTEQRKAEAEAKAQAERLSDTGRPDPVATRTYTQTDLDRAAEAAVEAALAKLNVAPSFTKTGEGSI
jgi:hypothetical protein